MSNQEPRRSISRYTSFFRPPQTRPVAPQPPVQLSQPQEPPPRPAAPQPPPPPAPPSPPMPTAPREDLSVAPSSLLRQTVSPPSPLPSPSAAKPPTTTTTPTGSPLLTSTPPAPPSPLPHPMDPAATTTHSPVLTSGQRSPLPSTPTKSSVATPLVPSSPSQHSPVLTSGHHSPTPLSPISRRSPPPSPVVKQTLSPPSPSPQANHRMMKLMSPLKLPEAHRGLSDSDEDPYDHKKVVLLEAQKSGSQIPAASKSKEVMKGKGGSVVTLAGENKGAVMDLSSPEEKKMVHGRARKLVEEEGEDGVLPAMVRAVLNSNVQGVNNSILHNTTYSHHDPGIHLVYPGRTRRRNFRSSSDSL